MSLRVDYEAAGGGYAGQRRTDPRIEARVHRALGSARTVVNVGAGTGSYEPSDRWVLAVEPSALMRSQRPPGAAPAIDGRAERLPLDDGSVDAAMAMATVHHWEPPAAGLRELRRVARGPVVVLTFDLEALPAWQHEYVGECVAADAPLMPTMGEVGAALGGRIRVEHVPVPRDCIDGFIEAYYARPEALLDPVVRASQSAWRRLAPGVEQRMVDRLAGDLAAGTCGLGARRDALSSRVRRGAAARDLRALSPGSEAACGGPACSCCRLTGSCHRIYASVPNELVCSSPCHTRGLASLDRMGCTPA